MFSHFVWNYHGESTHKIMMFGENFIWCWFQKHIYQCCSWHQMSSNDIHCHLMSRDANWWHMSSEPVSDNIDIYVFGISLTFVIFWVYSEQNLRPFMNFIHFYSRVPSFFGKPFGIFSTFAIAWVIWDLFWKIFILFKGPLFGFES